MPINQDSSEGRARLWRLLLLALPSSLRRELGTEMLRTMQQRTRRTLRQNGRLAAARLWALEANDLLRQAFRLRASAITTRLGRNRQRQRGERLMHSIGHELRFALRSLPRHPGPKIVVLLTLALAVGVNVAIFSVVQKVLFQPLPYQDPQRLVRIYETNRELGWEQADAAPANFLDWQSQSRAFEHLAVIRGRSFNLTGGDEPQRVLGVLAAGDLFPLLGVQPFLGRSFTPEEYQQEAELAVLVSHAFWAAQLGADPSVVGRQVVINRQAARVVGVLPEEFQLVRDLWGFQEDLWIPLSLDPHNRSWHGLRVLGRLKPGVSIDQAQAEMESIAAGLAQEHPESNQGWGIRLQPFRQSMVGPLSRPLLLLFAAVGAVLLIACVNLALLTLARSYSRHREMAVRIALGAGRGRLIRESLTESLLISLAGGLLGLALALWSLRAILALAPQLPRLDASQVTLDLPMLCFALLASLACGLLFGLLPAWQAWRGGWQDAVHDASRAAASPTGRLRAPALLMVAEVALAIVLLIGAGLLIRSLHQASIVEPGFDAENLFTFTMIPRYNYPQLERQAAFVTEVLERVRALPGVESAAQINFLPFSGHDAEETIQVRGRTESPTGQSAHFRAVSPGYFRTMRIPVRAGRAFTEADLQRSTAVLINQSMADRFWPGQQPLGKQFRRRREDAPWMEVAGVVADVHHHGLDRPAVPEFYVPYTMDNYSTRTIVVRTSGDPQLLEGPVREQVRRANPNQSIFDLKTMQEWMSDSLRRVRFMTLLLGILSGVAWVMAAVGIYGILSWGMNQRRYEIGVRKALGAGQRQIFGLAMSKGIAPAMWGIGLGLAAALLLTRALSSQLFGVTATDPLTYATVSLLFLAVAALACLIPARKAAQVDPLLTLRSE